MIRTQMQGSRFRSSPQRPRVLPRYHASQSAPWTERLGDSRLRQVFASIPRESFGLGFDALSPRLLGEPFAGEAAREALASGRLPYSLPTSIAQAKLPKRFVGTDRGRLMAVFDVDGTLYNGLLRGHWLRWLQALGILSFSLPKARDKIEDLTSGCWRLAGLSEAFLRHLSDGFVEYVLCRGEAEIGVPFLYPRVFAQWQWHLEHGYIMVLATHNCPFPVEAIGRIIGAEFVIATRPKIQGGILTDQIETPAAIHIGKVAQLYGLLDAFQITRQRVFAYSNNLLLDLPLLLTPFTPGHGFVTNPPPAFRRIHELMEKKAYYPHPTEMRMLDDGEVIELDRNALEAKRDRWIRRAARSFQDDGHMRNVA